MALITISHRMGSGAMRIGKRVAAGLNLELYDDDKLHEEALEMGIPSEELKGFDEKAPGFFDRLLGRKPEVYLDLMEAVVYEVAQRGHGVILGHGSQMLLRDFGCALHVLIHATEPTRIKNLMAEQGLSQMAAEKLIGKSDHEQRAFFRFAFHLDKDDPGLYDLIINTEKLGSELAAKFIMEAAKTEEIGTCSLTALDAMERLSQFKKVEAELLKNNVNLSLLHIELPQKGTVEIRGLAPTLEDRDRIIQVAQGVAGVLKVQSEIVVKSAVY